MFISSSKDQDQIFHDLAQISVQATVSSGGQYEPLFGFVILYQLFVNAGIWTAATPSVETEKYRSRKLLEEWPQNDAIKKVCESY